MISRLHFMLFATALCLLGALCYQIEQVPTALNTPLTLAASASYKKSTRWNIACVINNHSAVVDTLIDEFKKTLSKARPSDIFTLTLYYANNDPILLKNMSTQVLAERYDLIWSIGILACQTIAPLITKYQPKTPILMSSIEWTALQDLAKENPTLPFYATGWGGSCDWNLRIDLMKLLMPHVKKALLVHQNPTLSDAQVELIETLKGKGITVSLVHAVDIGTTINYLRSALDSVDAIIITRESNLLNAMDKLVTLANNYQVPLYVSDLGSVTKGAACGIGSDETTFGRYSAWFAKKVLFEGRHPKELPFQEIKDWSVHAGLNITTMNLQNTHTPRAIVSLMRQRNIVIKEESPSDKEFCYV